MKKIHAMTREELLALKASTSDPEVLTQVTERMKHMPLPKERVYKTVEDNGKKVLHPHGLFQGGKQTWVFGDSFLRYKGDPRCEMHKSNTYCPER